MDFDWDFDDDESRHDHYVTCERCHKGGLHWRNDSRSWYLAGTNGYEHFCNIKELHNVAFDDFEDLDK